jgi:hypothetical protein
MKETQEMRKEISRPKNIATDIIQKHHFSNQHNNNSSKGYHNNRHLRKRTTKAN